MNPITTRYPLGGRAAVVALALTLPTVHGALVGQWRGTDYTDGQNWTSTPATGSIVANVTGAPVAVTDGYAPGTKAVELNGASYFTVPQATSPLNGANALTLVAIFKPLGLGASGGGFHQGSGLIGMEQAGVTNDWGFSWNGNRISAAAPGAGVVERAAFSDPLYPYDMKVAMFTWSNTGVQQIFVNGVLVRSQNTGVTASRNAAPFALGAMTTAGGTPFGGEIAELRVYNSDESASAATIASELRDTYATNFILEEAALTPTGGRFVLVDTAAAQVDAGGTFALTLGGNPVPSGSIQASKTGGRTTVTFTATIDPGQIGYGYDLTVPKTGGGTSNYADSLTSHRLPLSLPGNPGSVGTWAIREILTGASPLPANASNIATAATGAQANPPSAENTAPVLNHVDPDTNNEGSTGNFNNDFNLLSNAAGDQNWIVTGKTQVTIAAPGEVHTFAIHGDDGFAMRVTGPGGGRFINIGGDAQIDPGDFQTMFRDGGTGDSNSRGTYRFDAAGTYDITYLGWDGGSGGYHEVAWAPGTHFEGRDTNTWRLVGNDSSLPAFRERWTADPLAPAAEAGTFGVRTYLATGATGLGNMTTFLNNTAATHGNFADAQLPYLNHRDPNNGGQYRFLDDDPFPGNNTGTDESNVVTVAKGRISIPSTGAYTFITTSDDGFVLRLKGVNGPDPSFRRVTSPSLAPRFQMSNPNEVFFDGAGQETRAIVDLAAGDYDVEYLTVENVGGFAYELGVAAGEWPHATDPPSGFNLLGAPGGTVLFPAIAAPGWTVESSLSGLTYNPSAGFVGDAEQRIADTAALPESHSIWATYGVSPANRTTTWSVIDFRDPEDGSLGSFGGSTSAWPLNRSATAGPPSFDGRDNDYSVRATGTLVITQAGTYHLGFQGDDGGYMYFYGKNGTSAPTINSIVYTNHPNEATIGTAPGSDEGTNNAITVAVGTGNSRTLVSVDLEVGEYEIKTLFSEGGGGSWWEVIGGSATASYNYPLLSSTGGSATLGSGLTLVAQPTLDPNDPNFAINSIVLTGNPITSVSFNIVTQAGGSYTVQGSVDLENWITLDADVSASDDSTPFSVNLADFPALSGQSKVFFRAVFNE